MKNLKNTASALVLAAVMAVGATATNAGIILSDRSVAPATETCSTSILDTVIATLEGIILSDRSVQQTCPASTSRDGIILSD